jgi:hypothetical protein
MGRTVTAGPWRIPAGYRRPLAVGAVVVVVGVLVVALVSERSLGQAVFALYLLPLVVGPGLTSPGDGAGNRRGAAVVAGFILAGALLLPVVPDAWTVVAVAGLVGGVAVVGAVLLVRMVRRQARLVPQRRGGSPPEPGGRAGYGDTDRVLAASVAAVVAATPWFPPDDLRFWVPAALYAGAVLPVRAWWATRARTGAPVRP